MVLDIAVVLVVYLYYELEVLVLVDPTGHTVLLHDSSGNEWHLHVSAHRVSELEDIELKSGHPVV